MVECVKVCSIEIVCELRLFIFVLGIEDSCCFVNFGMWLIGIFNVYVLSYIEIDFRCMYLNYLIVFYFSYVSLIDFS